MTDLQLAKEMMIARLMSVGGNADGSDARHREWEVGGEATAAIGEAGLNHGRALNGGNVLAFANG